MKKLALLMFAILILGCDTETPVVEGPPPIIEEPTPVVASGEHFRLDIEAPRLVASPVDDGDADVDPEPLNAGGFRFDFNERLKLHKIDLLHDGKSLGWLGTGLSERVTVTLILTAVAGKELQFDTEYVIKIYVQDHVCASSRFEIRFRTKPKP